MKYLYLLFLSLSVFAITAQEAMTLEAVQDSVNNQLALFPQEKMHVHTDRNLYVPGEKIWFKAYVVDALAHQSPTVSQYAYMELINASDSLVQRVTVHCDENGLFHGNLFLSELVPEGDYTLRAYTRYMENLGDDYFFKKPVRINSLKAAEKQDKKKSGVTGDYEVSFFPEGGYLTEGVNCKVAFKALNRNGATENVTGEVVDAEGNRITTASTVYAGMGYFHFIPETGKDYFFIGKNQSGQEKRFTLPAAKQTCSIAVYYRKKRYFVEVKQSPDLAEQTLYMLVHCRGDVLYYAQWNNNKPSFAFPEEPLPAGVIQLVLFDEQLNPVSERLIFNKNEDQARLEFTTDKFIYEKRENVVSEIQLTDSEGNPLAGHVSVAVTDDRDVAVDTDHTILTSLLLTSELKGYIESPGYYLRDDKKSETALDLLMMTNGWRRYDITEAMKGRYMVPETGYEVTKAISGTVKSALTGRPVTNSEVLVASSDGGFAQVETDSAGRFSVAVDYPDSVTFFVQAKKSGVELVIDWEEFPVLKHAPKSASLLPAYTNEGLNINNQTTEADLAVDFVKKANQRAQYDEDMRLVQLQEVTVTAKRIEKRDEARLAAFAFNINSDVTIYREDIEKYNLLKVSQLLYNVAGVRPNEETGEIIILRNRLSSINFPKSALILVDGIYMNGDFKLDDLNIHDVETIDIFKGASTALFGSRGSGGVISVTTRRGEINKPDVAFNNINYTPAGYQKPVEFYSPKYDTPASKSIGTPDYRSTIYWKPDLLVSKEGKASFDFYTSDFPTTYSVVMEGLSNDGKIIRQVESIEVR